MSSTQGPDGAPTGSPGRPGKRQAAAVPPASSEWASSATLVAMIILFYAATVCLCVGGVL